MYTLKRTNNFKTLSYIAILYCFSTSFVSAALDSKVKTSVQPVSYEHVLSWSVGLLVVLCLFFACVWFMRRMGALQGNSRQSLRIMSGLSVGTREKILLVQVGEKQLLLGVTPGRIDKLLVLEGDEQLLQEKQNQVEEGDFANKLKQVMTGAKK